MLRTAGEKIAKPLTSYASGLWSSSPTSPVTFVGSMIWADASRLSADYCRFEVVGLHHHGVFAPAFYGVRIYSRVPDARLYRSPNDMPGGGLGRFYRLPLTFSGSMRRLRVE